MKQGVYMYSCSCKIASPGVFDKEEYLLGKKEGYPHLEMIFHEDIVYGLDKNL